MTTSEQTPTGAQERQLQILAAGGAVVTAAGITYVGWMVFESLLYVIAGLLMGGGTFFILQFAFDLGGFEEAASGEGLESRKRSTDERPSSDTLNTGATGFALEAGGMTLFVWGFVAVEQLLAGVGVAVAVVLAVYLLCSLGLRGLND